jgi:hypothetical protein
MSLCRLLYRRSRRLWRWRRSRLRDIDDTAPGSTSGVPHQLSCWSTPLPLGTHYRFAFLKKNIVFLGQKLCLVLVYNLPQQTGGALQQLRKCVCSVCSLDVLIKKIFVFTRILIQDISKNCLFFAYKLANKKEKSSYKKNLSLNPLKGGRGPFSPPFFISCPYKKRAVLKI